MKLVADSVAKTKKAKGQCLVFGCTVAHEKRGSLCAKHSHERKKEKNPLKYWFGVLRRNARRRHKTFTITIEDFKVFCDETGYLTKKGRNVGCITIDREIDELGYIPGNIRALEHGANVRKRWVDYYMRQEQSWQEPPIISDDDEFFGRKPVSEEDVDLPF